jgi:hypothetical protein
MGKFILSTSTLCCLKTAHYVALSLNDIVENENPRISLADNHCVK